MRSTGLRKLFLAFACALSLCGMPVAFAFALEGEAPPLGAAHIAQEPAIAIEGELTAESASATVEVAGFPENGLIAICQFGPDDEIGYVAGGAFKILNSFGGNPGEGTNVIYFGTERLSAGNKVVAFLMKGYTASDVVAQSEPVVVTSPTTATPEVEISSALVEGDSAVTFNVSNLPDGAMAAVKLYDADETEYTWSGGDTLRVMNAATGAPAEGANTVTFSDALVAGKKVVVLVMTGYSDAAVVAVSEPAVVQAAAQPEKPTRQQIIDACSVTMESPNTEGDLAGKFSLADTSARVHVQLHESIDFARLTVYAYPKAASFDPDNASYNKSLFSTMVRDGDDVKVDDVTAEFGDKLAALDTTYNLVAYVYFQVPPEDNYDYQYKTSRSFEVVDLDGQGTEPYAFPNASIVESALPVGATSMHVNLTGDERLFQLAVDTKDEWLTDKFTIHMIVSRYADDGELFDLDENPGEKLWDEEATEPFSNREIEFSEPLKEGERVIAVVYWTNYTGDKAVMPVPRGNDYGSERVGGADSQSVLVSADAPPVVATPAVTVAGPITTATTGFNVNVKNLPDGAIMFVDRFAADEEIEHSYSKALKMFTGYGDNPAVVNGANAVEVKSGKLAVGDRIVAFILSSGETVAQSEPVVVTEAAQPSGSISITADSVASDASSVTVNLKDDPDGAAVVVKFFGDDDDVTYDKGTSLGYFANVVQGDNSLTFSMNADKLVSGGKLVAFLLKDASAIAQSEPVPVTHAVQAPAATIGLDGDDVALTQGDRFISMTWSVDAAADNVSYDLYQFAGEELDTATATSLYHGTLVVSKYNHSGTTWVPLNGKLEADAKLQIVITADGQQGFSNTMTVGATPAWAKVTPTIAIDQSALKDDAATIKLVVNYPQEYVTELGAQFYADIKVYQYPGKYTDDDFEDEELDENTSIAKVIAGANSSNAQTNGSLELTLGNNVKLEPGNRIIAKIRLPQAERQDHDSMWEDYLSMSIPVVSADASIPGEMILVYNLGADTAKGEKLRAVCEELGLQISDLTDGDLVKQVGALVGRDGYDEIDDEYAGQSSSVEYMLMANLSEASLDRFLDAMQKAGVSIGAKGITTDTNVNWPLGRLIVDIAEEHETMTALVDLQQLVKKAEEIERSQVDSDDAWNALRDRIAAAKALYNTEGEEPTADQLREALAALEEPYLAATGQAKLDGQVRLTATLQDDGTYELTAAVEGATAEGLAYAYSWNTGETTATLTGVAAADLGARIATVTAEGAYGTLEARLSAPQAPADVVVSTNAGRVSATWEGASEAFNQPAADAYLVELLKDGNLVESLETAKPAAEFAGLDAGAYTLKICAKSVVGRSDKVALQVDVPKAPASDSPAPAPTVTPGKSTSSAGTAKAAAQKKANPMKVKAKVKTVKASKLKKSKQVVKKAIVFKKKAAGTVTYAKVKKGSSKYLSINKKTGKITVKKGTKAGTYKVKVKVKAKGNSRYKAKTQTVTVKVKVK